MEKKIRIGLVVLVVGLILISGCIFNKPKQEEGTMTAGKHYDIESSFVEYSVKKDWVLVLII